jgi:hypothetical protein
MNQNGALQYDTMPHSMQRNLAWCQFAHQTSTQNHLGLNLDLRGKRPLPIARVLARSLKMYVEVCLSVLTATRHYQVCSCV